MHEYIYYNCDSYSLGMNIWAYTQDIMMVHYVKDMYSCAMKTVGFYARMHFMCKVFRIINMFLTRPAINIAVNKIDI